MRADLEKIDILLKRVEDAYQAQLKEKLKLVRTKLKESICHPHMEIHSFVS